MAPATAMENWELGRVEFNKAARWYYCHLLPRFPQVEESFPWWSTAHIIHIIHINQFISFISFISSILHRRKKKHQYPKSKQMKLLFGKFSETSTLRSLFLALPLSPAPPSLMTWWSLRVCDSRDSWSCTISNKCLTHQKLGWNVTRKGNKKHQGNFAEPPNQELKIVTTSSKASNQSTWSVVYSWLQDLLPQKSAKTCRAMACVGSPEVVCSICKPLCNLEKCL